MSKPVNDIWQDPNVKAALKEGRRPDDIAVLSCPKCGRWSYYNQGSHFWCRFCEQGWANGIDECAPIIRYMMGWSVWQVDQYCARKGWKLYIVDGAPMPFQWPEKKGGSK